jgi:hypothetical protein
MRPATAVGQPAWQLLTRGSPPIIQRFQAEPRRWWYIERKEYGQGTLQERMDALEPEADVHGLVVRIDQLPGEPGMFAIPDLRTRRFCRF